MHVLLGNLYVQALDQNYDLLIYVVLTKTWAFLHMFVMISKDGAEFLQINEMRR